MSDEDPGKLADQLDEQADKLEKHSSELSSEIKDVGEDWERKRADSNVPGARPPDSSGEQPEDADADADERD